jgi:hypothetical protein
LIIVDEGIALSIGDIVVDGVSTALFTEPSAMKDDDDSDDGIAVVIEFILDDCAYFILSLSSSKYDGAPFLIGVEMGICVLIGISFAASSILCDGVVALDGVVVGD